MNDEPISVIDAAQRVGLRKQTVFKLLKRIGVSTFKERNSAHKGQAIAYISQRDFAILQSEIEKRDVAPPSIEIGEIDIDRLPVEFGVFYLIQLEPDHDPGRFKVGFAANISERYRSHRCSAPFAVVTKTWPCKRLWERTVIDCVTIDCEKLHTEVFRCNNLDSVIAKCDQFFAIMPAVSANELSPGDSSPSTGSGHFTASNDVVGRL